MKKCILVVALTLLIFVSLVAGPTDEPHGRVSELEARINYLENKMGNLESQVNFLSSQEYVNWIISQL